MNERQRPCRRLAAAAVLLLSLAAAGDAQDAKDAKAPKFDPASAERSLDWFVRAVADYERAVASGNELKIEAAKKAANEVIQRGAEISWDVRVVMIGRSGLHFRAERMVTVGGRRQHFTVNVRTHGAAPIPDSAKDLERGQAVTVRAKVARCEADFSRAAPSFWVTLVYSPKLVITPK